MSNLPIGTVAFLMSDIEGSTRLVTAAGDRFPALLDDHFRLLRGAIEANGGTVVSTEGDSVFAVLPTARAAVAAAVAGQRALADHEWPGALTVNVRMGIHVGDAVFGGRDYTGIDVHRAARVMAAAWGGEILVTQQVSSLAGSESDGVSLRDLGVFTLRDIAEPERLYQVVVSGLRAEFPPPRTESAAAPTNLPTPLTRFVGRTRELAEVEALLGEARLVMLIGPGGTGKTRLAIEVGRASLASFEGGVFFVALEAVRDPDLVLPQIAQTLGIVEVPNQPIADTLAAYLNDRHLLLVLDNLEQVVSAAPRISALLSAAQRFAILVSSRESLGVAGERVYPVPTLAFPVEPGSPSAAQIAGLESVELFVERARHAKPTFELNDDNAPAVAAICRRLDGLPLALELAAARVNVLTPAQILDRLDHRLTLLAGSRRDVTDRQRTLRGAIDWSYDLLSDDEKAAFRRFSVFAGGADLDAVLAVLDSDGQLGADSLDLLGSLVGRSLVRSSTEGELARYAMLETIREYALEQLVAAGGRDSSFTRHAEYFAAFASAAQQVLRDPDRDARLEQLDMEMPNFRVAIESIIAGNRDDLATQMAVGLKDFWRTRSHLDEACALLQRVLREVSFAGDDIGRVDVLGVAAELANWKGDYLRARAWTDEVIDILERAGDKPRLAQAYSNLGWSNITTSPEVSRQAFDRSITAARAGNDSSTMIGSQQGLAIALYRLGDVEAARASARAAIDVGNELRDQYSNSFNILFLGFIEMSTGDHGSAARHFEQALASAQSAGADVGILSVLDIISVLLLERGETLTAARLAMTAERMRNEIGGAPTMEIIGIGKALDRIRERAPEAYESAAIESPAMTRDDAIAVARSALSAISEQG